MKFCKTHKKDTWGRTWDGTHEGWVSADAVYHLSRRVGIMGPLAALMGRLADYHICNESTTTGWAMKDILEDSVELRDSDYTPKRKFFTDQPYDERQGARVEYEYSQYWNDFTKDDAASSRQHG